MAKFAALIPGVSVCAAVVAAAVLANSLLPIDLVGTALLSLLLGMLLNPLVSRWEFCNPGISWTSRWVLRGGIILTGVTLSLAQVLQAGRYALLLMAFTLSTAFGVGYICRRLLKIDWKLCSLLSVSTAICGGTAVATVGPVIKAQERDIAYALSATFIFDLMTVVAFPWFGTLLGLSDTSFGLWVGTAVNDTSSVIAAGYAFSDPAGSLATIVKLTRTLFIVPIVLVFAWIHARRTPENGDQAQSRVRIAKIFPWFVLGFLAVVGIRSSGVLSETQVGTTAHLAKLLLAAALGAIGMKTSFREVAGVGAKPMIAGVVIDTAVVIVSLFAQAAILSFVG